MPYEDPTIATDGESYRIALNLDSTAIVVEPRISRGPFPEDPTSPEVFQDLVNHLALKYELYAERFAPSVSRCLPDAPPPDESV